MRPVAVATALLLLAVYLSTAEGDCQWRSFPATFINTYAKHPGQIHHSVFQSAAEAQTDCIAIGPSCTGVTCADAGQTECTVRSGTALEPSAIAEVTLVRVGCPDAIEVPTGSEALPPPTPTPTPTPTPNFDDIMDCAGGCCAGDRMGNFGSGTIDSKPTSILDWNPEVSTGWGPSSTGWTPNVRATRNVVATNTNPI